MAAVDEKMRDLRRHDLGRRRMLAGAAAATVGLAGAGTAWWLASRDDSGPAVRTGPDGAGRRDGTPATWERVPTAPLSDRSGVAAAWLGDRLFVWGGILDGGARPDAATWMPGSAAWMAAASASAGSAGPASFAVWDGREVLVGVAEAESSAPWNRGDVSMNDVGYGILGYDPATDAWRHVAPAFTEIESTPSFARQAVLLADGRLLVGVRGARPEALPGDLRVIDPATGGTELVDLGPFAATPYSDHSGEIEMAAVGDVVLAVPNWNRTLWVRSADGAWRTLPDPPEDLSLHLMTPVAIGDRAVVAESSGGLWIVDPRASETGASETGTVWTRVTENPFDRPAWGYPPVWSGTELFVPGAAYDPATNEWRSIEPPPRDADRQRQLRSFWADGALLLFGGEEYTCPDGADCDRDLGPDTLDGWMLVDP
jgi:hypothetical protein